MRLYILTRESNPGSRENHTSRLLGPVHSGMPQHIIDASDLVTRMSGNHCTWEEKAFFLTFEALQEGETVLVMFFTGMTPLLPVHAHEDLTISGQLTSAIKTIADRTFPFDLGDGKGPITPQFGTEYIGCKLTTFFGRDSGLVSHWWRSAEIEIPLWGVVKEWFTNQDTLDAIRAALGCPFVVRGNIAHCP